MHRFKPIHGVFVVLVFVAAILVGELALEGRLGRSGFERVNPGSDGTVRIDVSDLSPQEVRFFRFLNSGNQEVKFFVGRDAAGQVQVAFDANEPCAKAKRGYRHEGEWLVCNKCDKAFRLAEVNAGGGGCKPVPLKHQVNGGELLLAEGDVLQGWRFFR
ncbi:MAG TPA: Fe-S-containing protein [Thermoanaerobaculia bacterium]|nr:Fe-S-containing protein [Thermoanaerobaculia bacterium]HSN85563.1 Fe-S-containing protein [Thermoanaerobaculia bacterium]